MKFDPFFLPRELELKETCELVEEGERVGNCLRRQGIKSKRRVVQHSESVP